MEYEHIKNLVEENYNIKVIQVEKVKNTYKVIGASGEYCLKIIKYQYSHFYFIISAMEHLQKTGFKYIPGIIKNKKGESYICFDNLYAYLTPWIKCRESNYDNPIDLKNASIKLAELHNCSEGFLLTNDMKPRIGWFTWYKVFETRGQEILDFKKRIYQKSYKSEFDKYYLSIMEEELQRVERTLENLKLSNYFEVMDKEIFKRGFCHHDYAHHNVLVDDKGNLNIIDFDYCILDTHLHDLSSLSVRTMKEGKWDIKNFRYILENYSQVKEVKQEEIPVMASFIQFPQAFWQIGLQYYWEQQPWGEEFFMRKITKYNQDKVMREEFVNELMEFKLR